MGKNFEINIDEAALQRAIQPGIEEIERQSNEILHATVREVRDEMDGQPAEEVYDALATRLRAALPGFTLDHDRVVELAEAISEGTLEG